jgi:hypothetical protein
VATETEHIQHLERPPRSLWDRMLAEPERAPEHIALVAAERFGPQAEEWVRIAGPGHTPEKLARIAYRKHVRLARLVVALLWIQSRMIFYIAAAYGYDPRHPMRPAELLALQGVYATPAEARRALDGMGKLMAQAMIERALASRTTDRLHLRLLRYLTKRLARRYAGRLIPFIGSPLGAIQNAGATKEIGRLALSYYARP